jgi:hypothetical protein
MTPGHSPLISIVIPTRDRPEFAALALQALSRQSFTDFEVIVSDNAIRRPFGPDSRLIDGVRFRYVRPPKPVWMTDHWEFAVGHARGRYVGVLGDKSVLVPDALERVAAEIMKGSPDAVSWRMGVCQPSGEDLAGPCVAAIRTTPDTSPESVPPREALEYLLATYLNPGFVADHQLEIRGSIYHGVFSAALIRAMKERFGRVFRFYAPDLNAQCAAMQIARDVSHIRRSLELVMAGPSNGVAIGQTVATFLSTQNEAADGASALSPRLIPDLSASVSHRLASDLVALSSRTLSTEQWVELHRRAAFDLCDTSGWPDRSLKRSQWAALSSSAARFAPEVRFQILRAKWDARRSKAKRFVTEELRRRFGTGVEALRQLVFAKRDAAIDKRPFDHLFAALDAIAASGR